MKGALELSVNAIVILIIALAILGLVIGFAVTRFTGLSEQIEFTEQTPEPNYNEPVQLPGGRSTLQLSKNDVAVMEIRVYNPDTVSISANMPDDCSEFDNLPDDAEEIEEFCISEGCDYNSSDDTCVNREILSCSPSGLSYEWGVPPNMMIGPGQIKSVPLNLQINPETPSARYACSMTFSDRVQKTVFLDIK